MSFHGKQFKGAAKVRREEKREQAEARNRRADAQMRSCGHVHGAVAICSNPAVTA